MSAGKSFTEQVVAQRESLRIRLAALDYVAELNARVEQDPKYADARAGGGMALDPVDPTRASVPIVWLRALLAAARADGYGVVANSPETQVLARVWNDDYRSDDDEFDRLHASHTDLADALRAFMGTL